MKNDEKFIGAETVPLGLLRVGDQGKITIPYHIRKRFGISKGDLIEVTIVVKLKEGIK